MTIPGKGVHDVVYVATEHDTVYAFDAHSSTGDNAAPLWQTSFHQPGGGHHHLAQTGSSPAGYSLYPEMGITGTPVIDPATNTLYVVAFTQEVVAGGGHQLLISGCTRWTSHDRAGARPVPDRPD